MGHMLINVFYYANIVVGLLLSRHQSILKRHDNIKIAFKSEKEFLQYKLHKFCCCCCYNKLYHEVSFIEFLVFNSTCEVYKCMNKIFRYIHEHFFSITHNFTQWKYDAQYALNIWDIYAWFHQIDAFIN